MRLYWQQSLSPEILFAPLGVVYTGILSEFVSRSGAESLLLPASTNTICYWLVWPDITVQAPHWPGHSELRCDWLGVVLTLMTSLRPENWERTFQTRPVSVSTEIWETVGQHDPDNSWKSWHRGVEPSVYFFWFRQFYLQSSSIIW